MVQGPTPDLQIGHRRLDPADPEPLAEPLTQRLGIPRPVALGQPDHGPDPVDVTR